MAKKKFLIFAPLISLLFFPIIKFGSQTTILIASAIVIFAFAVLIYLNYKIWINKK